MSAKALTDTNLVWSACRGRNGVDNPLDLRDEIANEALNWSLATAGLGSKRKGSEEQTITGTSGLGWNQLTLFIPGQDETKAEIWGVNRETPDSTGIDRIAAGSDADNWGIIDSFVSRPQDTVFAAGNGKLFIAYKTYRNRLYVYDPTRTLTAGVIRAVGIRAVELAPSVADTGAGTYAATARHYRVRRVMLQGSNLRGLSEGSASTAFTPSGSGTHARISLTGVVGVDFATHWRVEASEDDGTGEPNGVWIVISGNIANTTLQYDDNVVPSAYDGDLAPEAGAFSLPPSPKAMIWDGNRLLLFGARWEDFDTEVLALAPINYWKLNEVAGSATAIDYGSGDDDGTFSGSPTLEAAWTTTDGGPVGRTGTDFDGSNDLVTISPPATGTTFSLAFWFKPDSTQADAVGTVLDGDNADLTWVKASSKMNYRYSAADHLNTTALTSGTTYHIALVVTAGNGVWYKDGSSNGTMAGVPSATFDSIGAVDAATDRLEGRLGDVMIFNYALTNAEVTLLANHRYLQDGGASAEKDGRMWFTPALDTTDFDDDERVSMSLTFQGWVDVNRNGGGEDRALVGPIDGQVLCGQSKGVYLMSPTGDATAPYRRYTLDYDLGMVSHHSSFMGQDEAGRPAAYWLDPIRGPYRYGHGGLQWMGYDIQDIWTTVNLEATTKVAHGVWDRDRRSCKWWIATGSANEPNETIEFFAEHGVLTERQGIVGGWTRGDGDWAAARCSAMLPTTIATAMSRRLSPYVGVSTKLLRGEVSGAEDDDGTVFSGELTSRAWDIRPLHTAKTLGQAHVYAEAANEVQIRQSLIRNYGDQVSDVSDVVLTASVHGESHVRKKFEDAVLTGAYTFQVKLGDVQADATQFTLDRWEATIERTKQELP